MDERTRRMGLNEAFFRELNDRVEGINRSFATITKTMTVMCECGARDCLMQLTLAVEEYEHARSDPTWFIVLPGHVVPDLEIVLEERDSYWLIAKRVGEAAELAVDTDPRT